jgi:hypothetical protein
MHSLAAGYLAIVVFVILMIALHFCLPLLDKAILWLERAGKDQ